MDDFEGLIRVTSVSDTVRITTRSAPHFSRSGAEIRRDYYVVAYGSGDVVNMHRVTFANRHRYSNERIAHTEHDLLVADCKAELAVTRIYHLSKVSKPDDLGEWLTDHISGGYYLFKTIEVIGFYRESDEVIWKLSPWCQY